MTWKNYFQRQQTLPNFFKISPILLLLLGSCNTENDPQAIIDKAIKAHGGETFENAFISFDFRNHHYTTKRSGGIFTHTRSVLDSTVSVVDILNNQGITREINGQAANLPDSTLQKYAASVNSVIYFTLLPYALNDAAVQKKFLRESMVNNEPYFEIEVTFSEEKGGEDHQDVFVYWIHQEDYAMDYLAYSYIVEGGGKRFREAVNQRKINGILFADFINYKSVAYEVPLHEFDSLFEAGKLEKLSEINLKNIQVEVLE